MALGPRLDLRQSQQLVMTPQLQQAIKLLALSNIELEAYLQDELEKNPLLDVKEASTDEAKPEPAAEPEGADIAMSAGAAESDAPLDVDHNEEVFHHDSGSDAVQPDPGALDGGLSLNGTAPGGAGADDFDIGERGGAAHEKTLHEVLIDQAAALPQAEQMVARHIIDLVDDAGYFTGSCEEIGWRLDLGEAAVEEVLKAVQTFEPTGVGARDLGECLAIQAREADRYDPCMAALLGRLDLLARGDLAALKRICRCDDEDLMDMIQEVRGYNPKPGLEYGGGEALPIVPDVFVAKRPKGGWKVEVNSATLPRLLVDRAYAADLAEGGVKSKETKAFLSECMQSANWLMNALDQRQRTIVKVAAEIVKQQEGFFLEGVSKLKPLTLRAIADEIDMHESTVSRVTSNKYMMCERGLFELKYFFTSAIQSADGGDAVSAEAVKDRIAALIAEEDPKKVLSDDKLVALLKAEGFDIARRTVAKYREALGLGSSVQRRRGYALETACAA
ncbi:MAG: RNA polymerase factor sigma-54 [Pseudomonadota bacterium]